MFPSLAAQKTYVAETNFASRKQGNVFASVQKRFRFLERIFVPKHMFPSLATMES